MLVLTRKLGEQIIIAGNIRLSIVEVGPGRVKLGIDAPRSVTVDRGEIHDKKQFDADESHFIEVPDLHNRIAGKLLGPDSPEVLPADASQPLRLSPRLKSHARLPKKPR